MTSLKKQDVSSARPAKLVRTVAKYFSYFAFIPHRPTKNIVRLHMIHHRLMEKIYQDGKPVNQLSKEASFE